VYIVYADKNNKHEQKLKCPVLPADKNFLVHQGHPSYQQGIGNPLLEMNNRKNPKHKTLLLDKNNFIKNWSEIEKS